MKRDKCSLCSEDFLSDFISSHQSDVHLRHRTTLTNPMLDSIDIKGRIIRILSFVAVGMASHVFLIILKRSSVIAYSGDLLLSASRWTKKRDWNVFVFFLQR